MSKPVLVSISEEYGYQEWYAVYSQQEFAKIVDRWNSMKGLNCLVPVDFIFPGAKPYFDQIPVCVSAVDNYEMLGAHVHQSDDSFLDGGNKVPEAEQFEIEGRVYTDEEISKLFQESRARSEQHLKATYPEQFEDVQPETGE